MVVSPDDISYLSDVVLSSYLSILQHHSLCKLESFDLRFPLREALRCLLGYTDSSNSSMYANCSRLRLFKPGKTTQTDESFLFRTKGQSTQYKIAMAFLVLWLGVAVVMIVSLPDPSLLNQQSLGLTD